MIVAERKKQNIPPQLDDFGEGFSDGRLTEASNGKEYRLREAILLSKQLGRPLREEEMKQFEL